MRSKAEISFERLGGFPRERKRERAMEIEETRVQAASPTWFSQRARRKTASNVGPIVNLKKKQ